MVGITSSLAPTFPAGVPGTVLGTVHSFILGYLWRYIREQGKRLCPWGACIPAGETHRPPYMQPEPTISRRGGR